jgi:hypothetical protein
VSSHHPSIGEKDVGPKANKEKKKQAIFFFILHAITTMYKYIQCWGIPKQVVPIHLA